MSWNKLTPQEAHIIEDKGTEAPFSGEYENNFEAGTYLCRRCNTPLYRSEDKFHSRCGWPSFDDEIPGAVKWSLDADGRRTEITCNACGAHLGHVFEGENFTPKNKRHCVNSLSMKFEAKSDENKETAVFGGGCFWCTEAIYGRVKGVLSVTSGYAGGSMEKPTYQQVCSGITGHAEVIQVEFDPQVVSYNDLLEVFWHAHDPTTLNRQGNDIGTQYRSIILYADKEQKEQAQASMKEADSSGMFSLPIVTQIEALDEFYPAEKYHYDYYKNNPNQPYCRAVISPKVQHFMQDFAEKLK